MSCEIATLKHELCETRGVGYSSRELRNLTHIGDNPMERALCISETMLARCELAEILRGERHDVIEQAKYDFP